VTTVRVVVADDEPLVRQGLRSVLELDPELDIVAEAGDGEEAVAVVREHQPDLALLDIRMPRLDGIEAVRRITADPVLASTRALVLTTFADEDLLVDAVRAGACGYLLKSMPPADIRSAVRSAASGQTAVAPLLVGRLLREYAGRRTAQSPLLDRLTDRETDVLREVATGRSNAEIAARSTWARAPSRRTWRRSCASSRSATAPRQPSPPTSSGWSDPATPPAPPGTAPGSRPPVIGDQHIGHRVPFSTSSGSPEWSEIDLEISLGSVRRTPPGSVP
jgi:DNA-binding NarL/FixJ family response regulator